jgi:hypothetical protein
MSITAAPRKARSGEKTIENLSYFIAIQTRVPALAWGGTGVAKTQFCEALAKSLGFHFYPLIGSCHAPEDFGGIPFPVYEEQCADLLPMRWVRRTRDPLWFIFMDEVTTIPQQVRPIALSMLSERRIGDVHLHPSTIICGACNPPELAPNAAPLEKSLLNRFYHHNWVIPRQSWRDGMRNDQTFAVPSIPRLPETWTTYRGKWSTLMAAFDEAKPSMLEYDHKEDDDRKSFPSPRAVQKAALLMAAAESVDAPAEVFVELLSGMVGSEYANEFLAYCSTVELYNPEEIVDGTTKVKWDKARFDVVACLPSAVIGAIKRSNTAVRFGNAVKFFVELCQHEADLALYPLSELCPMQPADYRWDKQAATVFGDIMRQLERN